MKTLTIQQLKDHPLVEKFDMRMLQSEYVDSNYMSIWNGLDNVFFNSAHIIEIIELENSIDIKFEKATITLKANQLHTLLNF